MLKSRGSGVGKSDPLDNIIRSMIKHVIENTLESPCWPIIVLAVSRFL